MRNLLRRIAPGRFAPGRIAPGRIAPGRIAYGRLAYGRFTPKNQNTPFRPQLETPFPQ